MKRVLVMTVRMASKRFPNKAMADLAGRPMLAQLLRRLSWSTTLNEVVIATTPKAEDDQLVTLANELGHRWYRGSEYDVLRRCADAVTEAKADVVVRVTTDCPLVCAEHVDALVTALTTDYDYAENMDAIHPRRHVDGLTLNEMYAAYKGPYPDGTNIEVMWADTLTRLDRMSKTPLCREHVTPYVRWEHPELFRVYHLPADEDNGKMWWSVDTPEQLANVQRCYEALDIGNRNVGYAEILDWWKADARKLDAANERVCRNFACA